MGNSLQIERLSNLRSQRLLYVVGIITILVILSQFLVVPHKSYTPIYANIGRMFMAASNTTLSSKTQVVNLDIVHAEVNSTRDSGFYEETFYEGEEEEEPSENGGETGADIKKERQSPIEFTSGRGLTPAKTAKLSDFNGAEHSSLQEGQKTGVELEEQVKILNSNTTERLSLNSSASWTKGKLRSVGFLSPLPLKTGLEYVSGDSDIAVPYAAVNTSLIYSDKKDFESQSNKEDDHVLQTASVSPKDISGIVDKPISKKSRRRPTSISDMNTLLRHGSPSNAVGPKWLSARDKELKNARLQIESAPILRNAPRVYASIFRNHSMFVRSYELMERVLRVYIYKEGQKPIFHQPYLRGIYASEGWFMKLMETNRQFVVRDPRKAHLFYLPFSSRNLRYALRQQNFTSHRDLENHMENYVHVIARKYRFWNRIKGADHFLVACHDWGPGFTRQCMKNCIRALCNSNIARGFEIGKDVSLPVTNIASAENPIKDIGGNLPSERPILAFFAGGMHGYLRPRLLQYWNNKEPDMKIFGPMARDPEGKARYREFMKRSKYCICARGYEVHTPRVVESIYFECVPVIISDDYVPPLFEIFQWESFCVFILEKDVPDLRNILLSIPESKYLEMHNRLKMVQQHFLWHKVPVKYDLFHMILHSIWYNRVFQVKAG